MGPHMPIPTQCHPLVADDTFRNVADSVSAVTTIAIENSKDCWLLSDITPRTSTSLSCHPVLTEITARRTVVSHAGIGFLSPIVISCVPFGTSHLTFGSLAFPVAYQTTPDLCFGWSSSCPHATFASRGRVSYMRHQKPALGSAPWLRLHRRAFSGGGM